MGSCRIVLDNPNGHAGGICKGKIICTFDSVVQIKGIRLELLKREYVTWTSNTTYTGEEINVMSGGDFIPEGSIGPGIVTEPFFFQLPNKCPQSCTTPNGLIQYELRATVKMPSLPNYENGVILNMISPIDFNQIPNLPMKRARYQDEKNMSCSCCLRGPLTLTVFLDKEAYVLGETMKVRVHIKNTSMETIREVSVKLLSIISEKAENPKPTRKYTEDIIGSFFDGPVLPYAEKDFKMDISIPGDLVLYNFDWCTLFAQRFTLTARANLPTCNPDMITESPIILGHIPLRTTRTSASHNLYPENPYLGDNIQGTIYTPSAPLLIHASTPLLTTGTSEKTQKHASTDRNPPSYYEITGEIPEVKNYK